MFIKKIFKKNKNLKLSYDVHESLFTACFLTLIGGILDAHTFLFRNGIFANTQTGNIVFLAISIANQNFSKTLNHVFSLTTFVLGIFITEILKYVYRNKVSKFTNTVLSIEIVFLTLTATIPRNKLNSLVISLISFVCSLQTNSFRSLKGSPYASTMCTGNLRSASATFLNFIMLKNKEQGFICLQFIAILLSFFTGSIVGFFLTKIFLQFTLFFCAFILLTIIILINLKF